MPHFIHSVKERQHDRTGRKRDGAPLATGHLDFVEDGSVYLAVAQRVDCEDSIVDMGPEDKDLTCEIYLNSGGRGKLLLGRIGATSALRCR